MMLLCWSLLSLCLSANAGITALQREPGENVTLECSLTQCPRSPDELTGMYLYHYSVEKEKELYYYHKSEKISPRSRYSGRVEKKGSLKNHNITISNLTVDDSGLYRCVYKHSYTEVICNVYILVISGEAPCPRSEKEALAEDGEKNPPLVLLLAAACSISIIATTIFLLLIVPRVKQWISRRKVRKVPQSSNDYVYEVMTKNGLQPLAAVEQ
ncbi:uncharacterized protein [Trachinotus anak]|uniref:uncharacterized protein n=1 Tax=Trachinotus anak TaxID=443729 RepID=UPI0039F1AA28